MIPASLLATFLLAAGAGVAERSRLEQLQTEQAEREAAAAALQDEADAAAVEAASLQQDLVTLGDEIAALERESADAAARLETLTAEESEAAAALAADRASLVRVMAALQRAEMRKPPPLAVSPDDATDAARAAVLLGAIAPELEERAGAVRGRIEEITLLRDQLAQEQVRLNTAQDGLDERRVALADGIEERAALEQELRAGAREETLAARRIASEARDLNDLIARLEEEARRRAEAERREREAAARLAEEAAERERLERERAVAAGEPVPDAVFREPESRPGGPVAPFVPAPAAPLDGKLFAEARGSLRAPAEGRLTARFGQARMAGSQDGVSIATRARAQVVSPFDARVEFADEFGNYGRMLILSVGDGYHIVLAGLERLYAVKGQSVLAGEPLGEMADREAPAPELYYEIRRDGAPLDPEPWIREGARAG